MKTLIIEDDYSSITMFKRYFEIYGKCDEASTGFDGMQKYQESLDMGSPYELIVIDIILPDMNGYKILEAIRGEENVRKFHDHERSKIIITTSLDDNENRKIKEKLRPGFESYYVKSFALDGIEKSLKDLNLKL